MLISCDDSGGKCPDELPEGYRIHHDPDNPALVRDDGSVVAVFSALGATPCEIRHAADRDREVRDGAKSNDLGSGAPTPLPLHTKRPR